MGSSRHDRKRRRNADWRGGTTDLARRNLPIALVEVQNRPEGVAWSGGIDASKGQRHEAGSRSGWSNDEAGVDGGIAASAIGCSSSCSSSPPTLGVRACPLVHWATAGGRRHDDAAVASPFCSK